ncbi:hypothetical protein AGMMS49587_01080 [Spirochaetia bacterium]|nr:hypothetical protein AGMMS49587_01080 [Spirochaetia bacterium]
MKKAQKGCRPISGPMREQQAVPYGDNGCLLNFAWGADRVTDYSALMKKAS